MRLWSLHPCYLDRAGLVAAWREALLAQAVIGHPGAGYSHHPQLDRFRAAASPAAAIASYLEPLAEEAGRRGYRFDGSKILDHGPAALLFVSDGQLDHEWRHLMAKLQKRSPGEFQRWRSTAAPRPHPLFLVEPGPIAAWEKAPRATGSHLGGREEER